MGNTPFDHFPTEIYLEIGSNLEASDLATLVRTCSRLHSSLQDMLYNIALTYTVKDQYGFDRTVLQWASSNPKKRKCTLVALVRKGADIFVEGDYGTLLHDAVIHADEDAMKLFIRSGIHPWTTVLSYPPIFYAVGWGSESTVRYLLYEAVDEWQKYASHRTATNEIWNQFTCPWDKSNQQWAFHEALSRAVQGGHLKVTEILCQHVDVSITLGCHAPFTTDACEGGSMEIMQMLLERGAKLNYSAIYTAARYGHLELVLFILSRFPFDVTDRDYCGRTPLHWAAENGHTEIVQTLLRHGVDYEVISEYTALELAVENRHDDIIKILADLPKSITYYGSYSHSARMMWEERDDRDRSPDYM